MKSSFVMVDFDFMRSCLKEKIQAKVVFQVKIRADDTAKKICFSQIRQTPETRRGKTVPLTDTLFGSYLYLDKPPSYVTTSLVLISHINPRHRLIRLGLSFRSFSRMSGVFFPEVFGTSSLSCHTWYLLHVFPL